MQVALQPQLVVWALRYIEIYNGGWFAWQVVFAYMSVWSMYVLGDHALFIWQDWRICPTDMHSNVYFSIRRLLHFWNLMSIWWKTFPVWLNMCELAVWLWGLQGSFGQTNLKQWLLSLVCCLSWWLRPAVRPCCAASWPPAQTPLWHLSRVSTWAARPCPKAHWQQAMCQPSWTLCPLAPECQPTSRWPSRPLMARSPSSALRTCTSWIRLRRKAWSCPTPAVLDLAPAALARCLKAALTRATRRSWMTTRWARDSASPASPMPPLMWPSRPTVRMSFEVAVRLWQSHHTSFPLGFFTMDFWPNAKSQEYSLTKWPLCSVNLLLAFSTPKQIERAVQLTVLKVAYWKWERELLVILPHFPTVDFLRGHWFSCLKPCPCGLRNVFFCSGRRGRDTFKSSIVGIRVDGVWSEARLQRILAVRSTR